MALFSSKKVMMLSGLCVLSLTVFFCGLLSVMMMSPQNLSERYVALSQQSSGSQSIALLEKAIHSNPYDAQAWMSYATVMERHKQITHKAAFTIANTLNHEVIFSESIQQPNVLRVGFLTIDYLPIQ